MYVAGGTVILKEYQLNDMNFIFYANKYNHRTGVEQLWIDLAKQNRLYKDVMAKCQTIIPVSYTHLDVYKRQNKYSVLQPGNSQTKYLPARTGFALFGCGCQTDGVTCISRVAFPTGNNLAQFIHST